MWKRYSRSKTYNDEVEYKRARNAVTSVYMNAKRNFEIKLAKNIKTNPKAFYSYVRSKSRTKDKVCPLKNEIGEIISDDEGICEVLNQFFSSVYTIENTMCNEEIVRKLRYLFPGDLNEVLCDVNITEDLVLTKLRNMSANKAPGVDGLVPRLLCETACHICKPLCLIFQASLVEGHVPKDWKRANVTPIYKKGPKNGPSNYRPISIMSQVCKLLESIIKDKITEHLQRFN